GCGSSPTSRRAHRRPRPPNFWMHRSGWRTRAWPGGTTRPNCLRAGAPGRRGWIPTSSPCPPEPHRLPAGVLEADGVVGAHGRHVPGIDLEHDLLDAEPLEGVPAEERGRLPALARSAVLGLADQNREPGSAAWQELK